MFCGYAGSGKTYAASQIQSILDPGPKTIFLTAFADAVKDDVAALYNLPRTLFDTQEGKASRVKTPDGERTARDLLITYSRAMKDAYGESVWAEEVVYRIRFVMKHRNIKHIIIHDLRFMSEIETMKREFASSPHIVLHTIRIVRPSVQSLPIPSEHDLDTYETDICIENSGTLDELNAKLQHEIGGRMK
jgi:hypothetical protein